MTTPVDHPKHYCQGEYETIDVIEDWRLGFCLGNAIKYISRAGHKENMLEDLKKARSSKFPPFPPKNKLLKIKYPSKVGNLEKGIKEGRNCVDKYCRYLLG